MVFYDVKQRIIHLCMMVSIRNGDNSRSLEDPCTLVALDRDDVLADLG